MARGSSIGTAFLMFTWLAGAHAELVPDFLMGTDPAFHDPALVKEFHRDFKGVWLQALQRPEADYQRMAANTVAKAHPYGIPGLVELVPALEAIVSSGASNATARFAAANALIVLDSRGSAEKLFEASQQYGSDLRQLVEPALARWDFAPARPVWTKRIEAKDTGLRDLVLAIRGLGHVRDTAAAAALSRIAIDVLRPSHIRLEAAWAMGVISDSGLESDADRLADDLRISPLTNRLCAVRMLSRHSSEAVQRVLIKLAGDADPSVVVAALKRLNEIDPELVVPLVPTAIKNLDPLVREEGIRTYLQLPQTDRIPALAQMLDDDHPAVRKLVGEGLFKLAKRPELDPLIRSEAMRILGQPRWQGQEQAALLLGMLVHKPAADRFVELLESERPEVMIHTAWGLRKLEEPRTVPAIVDKILRQSTVRRFRKIPGVDHQVAHLFEACGRMKTKAADALIKAYIPKDRAMDLSRSAAIWALGWIHEGAPDRALTSSLVDRILDADPITPESPFVKQMSIVSLVRMKDVDNAASIKELVANGTPYSALGLTTIWAVHQLTGEELPAPTPRLFPDGAWFLEPLKSTPTTPN